MIINSNKEGVVNIAIDINEPESNLDCSSVKTVDFVPNHNQISFSTGQQSIQLVHISKSKTYPASLQALCKGALSSNSQKLSNGNCKNGHNINNVQVDTTINWDGITYTLRKTAWEFGKTGLKRNIIEKKILKKQSGNVKAGNLVAIIGPSGAGKSTLLECISGRKRCGLEGRVTVSRSLNAIGPLQIAFIPQKDHLLGVFTVRESLYFASKLRNYKLSSKFAELGYKRESQYHWELVGKMMKELNLESCADVQVSKCSGGQAKRLSYAVELISKPEILVLDEPTSGLDSSSSVQCVQLLQSLTTSKTEKSLVKRVIISSIHQPSFTLLNIFHRVYVLSYDGRCIYDGPPKNLLNHFAKFDLNCNSFHNPADYAIEVSSGHYGKSVLLELEAETQKEHESGQKELVRASHQENIANVVDQVVNQKHPMILHTWILLLRTWLHTYRDPQLMWLRIAQHVIVALTLSMIYLEPIGKEDGCFGEDDGEEKNSIVDYQKQYLKRVETAIANSGFLFFCLTFAMATSITTTVLTFPLEMLVFLRERTNGWYNCAPYYYSKLIADFPFLFLMLVTFSAIVYPLTEQEPSFWRFAFFTFFLILCSIIAQSMGMLFSAVFMNDYISAVFMAPASMVPVLLFSGYFVRLSGMPYMLRPLAYISYVRYAFEGTVAAIYGYGRCNNVLTTSPITDYDYADDGRGEDSGSGFGQTRFVEQLMQKFKVDTDNPDTDGLSRILGVNETCIKPILSSFKTIYGINFNEPEISEGENITLINSTIEPESFVMRYFDISDKNILSNIIVLMCFIVVIRLLTYYLLLHRSSFKK